MARANIPACAYQHTNGAQFHPQGLVEPWALALCGVGEDTWPWPLLAALGANRPRAAAVNSFAAHHQPISPGSACFSVFSISNKFLKNRVYRLRDFRGASGMPQHYQQILHELAVLRFSFSFKSAVCHAELNAIMNKNSADVKGCTMYVALFPCNECAKLIIQAGRTRAVPFVAFASLPAQCRCVWS